MNNKNMKEREEVHKAIWSIADDLRGAVDGWDFKQYILGIMFYRYISENITKYINDSKISKIMSESINKVLNEGIDFDPNTKTVSYNPSHEDNVDTSIENNPSMDGNIVSNVEVWSIFKRKKGLRGDGNPLIYALKGEGGWTFKTDDDRNAIEQQFKTIASKFAKMYPIGVTILMPSGNELNNHIAEIVLSQSKNAELIEGVICKITTQEVDK